jgi:UDP-N-acetylglucosamine 2-epimerase
MHRAENTESESNLISIIRAFEILAGNKEISSAGHDKSNSWSGKKEDDVQASTEGKQVDSELTIVFPIHPRTAKILREKKLYDRLKQNNIVKLIEPLGYVDFVRLMQNSKKVITDSGGVQKESFLLSVPCITIRNNTEWIETVSEGWNLLTGTDTNRIVNAVRYWIPHDCDAEEGNETGRNYKRETIFGTGKTSVIISDLIKSFVSANFSPQK